MLRGKKWENERSQESRISSKADKEEGRAVGKRLAVLNGNLCVCVCVRARTPLLLPASRALAFH